jgi:hypothetical protein
MIDEGIGINGDSMKYMTKIGCVGLAIQFCLTLAPSALAGMPRGTEQAKTILQRVDSIRFPEGGYQADVTITTTSTDNEPEVRSYRILSKGNSRTLVKTMSPAIDRDQILLMRGRDLWAFLPNLSQPIRLPLAQRLTGEVANGDLARSSFSGDYNPRILRKETIDNQPFYVLRLDAVDFWVTYHKVFLWVDAKNGRPYKAEFHALSGRLLKTCYYQSYKEMGGAIRPTRIVINDGLNPDRQSVLDYTNLVKRELPDKVFDKDFLKKLSR